MKIILFQILSMKVKTKYNNIAKLIAYVSFFVLSAASCENCGKSNSKHSKDIPTISKATPEEMFSADDRKNFDDYLSNNDVNGFVNMFQNHSSSYFKKIGKDFPAVENDDDLAKRLTKEKLLPYFTELKSIVKSNKEVHIQVSNSILLGIEKGETQFKEKLSV